MVSTTDNYQATINMASVFYIQVESTKVSSRMIKSPASGLNRITPAIGTRAVLKKTRGKVRA
jgi:hypothetical protein